MLGEVLVLPHTENPARFARGATLLAGASPGDAAPCEVAGSRPHRGVLIVKFRDVGDRDAAEALRGALLFVGEEDLPEPGEDAFWPHRLVGAEVLGPRGERLGTVAGVLARPEQDLWEVETSTGRVLLPAAKGIVVSVDLEAGRVVVDPPAGLFGED